mgnify:CR=1 FL=1
MRLSQVLFGGSGRTFASFSALPSNIEAIEACLRFTTGVESFVCLYGPSGWGKSHLLQATANRLRELYGEEPEPVNADVALGSSSWREPQGTLVLDEIQTVLGKPRSQIKLRMMLERRVRTGRPTLLAATMPTAGRLLRNNLPGGRAWLLEGVLAPEPAERTLLLRHLAAAEGLTLPPRVTDILARELHGDARTFLGALKRLRMVGTGFRDDRAGLKALGTLDPFFADNADWDLKRAILDVLESQRATFPMAAVADLAAFAMLRVAGLNEAEVARALDFEPAEAYVRASRYEAQRAVQPALDRYVDELADLVLRDLSA